MKIWMSIVASLLLSSAQVGAQGPTRLELEVGERYRFVLTEKHQAHLGKLEIDDSTTEVLYVLDVLSRSPEGEYDIAMSYRTLSRRQLWEERLREDPNLLPYARLEQEGWRMTVREDGLIQSVRGPARLFDDLSARVATMASLAPALEHMERGIGNEGLRGMMQDDLVLDLPPVSGEAQDWERRSALRSPFFEEVGSSSRERFVELRQLDGRSCAQLVAEGAVEVVEPGDTLAGIVSGNPYRAGKVDNSWRNLDSSERIERCVDSATGLPLRAETIRSYGVEVMTDDGSGPLARMTIREHDTLRWLTSDEWPSELGDVWLYWGRQGEIGRMRPDGSESQVIHRGGGFPDGVALDEAAGKVYWSDSQQGAVFRADLDGAHREEIHQGQGSPGQLVLSDGSLFWADSRARSVWRLDPGSEAERLSSFDYFNPSSLALWEEHVYWTTASSKRLQRVQRDGSGFDDEVMFLSDTTAPFVIVEERICWLDDEDPALWCSNLDGEERVRVATETAKGLAGLTAHDGDLYWIASREAWRGPSTLRRVSLAGGTVSDLVTVPGWARGLAVGRDAFFWTEGRELRTMLRSGGKPRTLVGGGVDEVVRLASQNGKLYWIEKQKGLGVLRRSNFDGSDVEDLVREIRSPTGLAVSGEHVLWSDNANGDCAVRRARLDGSEVETLVDCGSGRPDRLIASNDALFWADVVLDTIARSGLDGSSMGPVLTSQNRFNELMVKTFTGEVPLKASPAAVAVYDGKAYWTDSAREKIVRADLSGADVEDLITGLGYPGDLAVRAEGIFWVDSNPWRIRRAHLDGTAIRDVVTVEDGGIDQIALSSDSVFWSGTRDDEDRNLIPYISRAGLDGSGVETLLVDEEVSGPGFQLSERQRELIVAFPDDLIVADGMLYWPEHASHRILRAPLDGSRVEVVAEDVRDSEAMAFDGEWVYWVDNQEDQLMRARLDGSEASPLFEIEGAAQSLAIADGRVFWVDRLDDRVVSKSLESSPSPTRGALEVLFAAESFPPPGYSPEDLNPRSVSGLALLADSLLFTDKMRGTLERVELGTSDVEILAEKKVLPKALRTWNADLYWIDGFGIQRARVAAPGAAQKLLDRRGVEDILLVTVD